MRISHYLMQQQARRKFQRGFYIGPALGTIAIVVLVSLFVYGVFQYISASLRGTIESNNLMAIVSGAKSLKSGGSYANVDNAVLQRIKAFGNMTGSTPGGTVRNGWGGTVVVTGSASQLEIRYSGVPTSACERFLASAKDSGEFAADSLPTCSESDASDLTFIAY
ncbi:type 4 pilus major pilin [Pollutimonas bauzanensis]|uniref:PilS N terminal n=1 Tax=Pollutimonas bauzanensis TaxID=658167 RepID=A0A1M5YHI8_9BURK|nr:type 4 pilus major pilin [Pollutimonas bauzanensis]SHI11511.1 PilS N terminal [Pollutimonas bauzanensis]